MIAGTLQHPKTFEFVPRNRANMVDLTKLLNEAAFALIVNAHRDVTTGPWSMDLVRAALVQYPKFLAMMVVRPSFALVPTTTIDLAWHTHQLTPAIYAIHTPAIYAMHTRALTGQIVNHDDSDDIETETAIADGAKAMPDAWRAVFDEDYYRPNACAGCLVAEGTTAEVADCFRTGERLATCPRWPKNAQANKVASYYRSGNCMTDGVAKSAACYFSGNCMVGPIGPMDGKAE
ncbi:hypothetical protein GGF32_001780 [Allomyces javanicus]|nr:hypothetical protein GGF32_001780 [Allomyces javanicus]